MIEIDTDLGTCNVLAPDGTVVRSVNLNDDSDFVEMTWTFEDGTKAHFGKNFNREWLKSLRYEKQILLLQEKIRLLESQR